MTLSLNDRAAGARRPAGRRRRGAAAWRSPRCPTARGVIDCGAQAAGGFEAGRALRRDLHGAGWGRSPTRRWSSTAAGCPALTVTTDRPAVACLAAQYAGWRLDRDGYFAMGSGPGRALIRAEDLYDDLDWDEHASAAVLCLETREPPPAEVADFVARARRRAALGADAADGADGERGRRRADRGAGRRDRAAQAPRARLRRAARRRAASAAARCRRWRATTWRRSGAPTTPCSTAARSTSPSRPTTTTRCATLVERLPASASSDYGEPFGKVLEGRGLRLLRDRPAAVQPRADQAHERRERPQLRGGRGQPRGAGALVLGLTVAILGSSGGWHAQQLTDALAARGHEHRARARDAHGRAHRRRRRGAQPRRVARRLRRRDRARHPARLARAGDLPRRRAARARGARRDVRQRPARDRAHHRQVPRLGAAGARGRADAADDRLRARRRRARGLRGARRRRHRQAAVRLDGRGDDAGRRRRRRLPRLPRAGARARRLLPAGDAAARRPRPARAGRRRPGARGDRAGRLGLAREPRARRPARRPRS